ncbi:MAG: alpha/beta fold hydrolase [Pseudomonadota bacterium]
MTQSSKALVVAASALVAIALGVWQLEAQRSGLAITEAVVDGTPVTYYAMAGSDPAPVIVVAHGFAGSRPLMEAYALALAQAGYVVASFDFEGHGQNPMPMSGDVTSVDGTTRLLIEETLRVVDAASALAEANGQVSLLGHSMASDIIIRAAQSEPAIDAVIAISPFSEAVTAEQPSNFLMVTGEWEPQLRAFALEAAQMVDVSATENAFVTGGQGGVVREAFVAPNVEHVGVLFSKPGIERSIDWLNMTYGRDATAPVPARLAWVGLVLSGTVVLAWPLSRLIPQRSRLDAMVGGKRVLAALLVPPLVAPALALFFPQGFLPVLVADYLAVHMAIYGALQLLILRGAWPRIDGLCVAVGFAAAAYGIAVFGMALDRYFANFTPTAARAPIITALALGSVLYMLADNVMASVLPRLWQRVAMRLAFLASLGIAVALDFERLFFLILIIPIIILFYLVFGFGGRWIAERIGPLAPGLGMGLLLAWSLGVTFPLFA